MLCRITAEFSYKDIPYAACVELEDKATREKVLNLGSRLIHQLVMTMEKKGALPPFILDGKVIQGKETEGESNEV